jgi:hypothetical protein
MAWGRPDRSRSFGGAGLGPRGCVARGQALRAARRACGGGPHDGAPPMPTQEELN